MNIGTQVGSRGATERSMYGLLPDVDFWTLIIYLIPLRAVAYIARP